MEMIYFFFKKLMTLRYIRSLSWRSGRKLYCSARLEYANDPETNGEYWLLGRVLSACENSNPILIDVGANKGEWTNQAVTILHQHGIDGYIWAFEPTRSTFDYLQKRVSNLRNVNVQRAALAKRTGEAKFFVIAPLAGTNSLYKIAGSTPEVVKTLSLDDFLMQQQIGHVDFLKSDVEGFDMDVLLGAEMALQNGTIDVWQFEYSYRWLFSRHYLKDVFDYIADKPYKLGKLYGNGIEFYSVWHPELERFFETNFVLVKHEAKFERFGRDAAFDVSNVAHG